MRLKSLLAIMLLGASALAGANVKTEMFQMNRQLGSLIHAENAEEFSAGAEKFIQAASEAKGKLPASLSDEPARFEGYQKAMQETIDLVKQADELAKQGKLDEAKTLAKQLNQLKKAGHNEYKK